jgi:hypothetical protein
MAASVIVACAGCYPAPHTEWSRPEISGNYVLDGHPARGVEVFLGYSHDGSNPCPALERVAVTDASGSFHVDPETEWVWWRDLLNGDRIGQQHFLCFQSANGRLLAGEFSTWRMRYEHVHLSYKSPPVESQRPLESPKVCYLGRN